ncbi:MAG: metal-sensitive transcriptional regulator [Bacillota bacterium]|jgi:DNA-binding FrmR family transcriptional regulator
MEKCPQENIIQRLKKIEGQVKGIQRMIEDGKRCTDILVQIAAIRAAINKVGVIVFENHTRECLKTAIKENKEDETIEKLIHIMAKFTS